LDGSDPRLVNHRTVQVAPSQEGGHTAFVAFSLPRLLLSVGLAGAALSASWILLIIAPDHALARFAAGLGVLLTLLSLARALIVNRRLAAELERKTEALPERRGESVQALQRQAEAERLRAVGRVAGAVAHDFNNLLTAVSGHTELARMRSDDQAIRDHLDHVLLAVQRGVELSRRLVATAHPPAAKLEPIDLAVVVVEAAARIRAELPPGMVLALEVPPGSVRALADATQMQHLLTQLCANAGDAMPAGGRLVIGLAAVAGGVELSVTDSGSGMTDAVRAHLFEPYFSTKGGRGRGFGLAMVHAIVHQHGGSIGVDSGPGGSTFRVRLPAA
jgi:two-component system cell cycle sensor histidine kinase/response regulator CckA